MSRRSKLILSNALRLKGDDQIEPKRSKLNECNTEQSGAKQQPQSCSSTFTLIALPGANISNFEDRKTDETNIQIQNNENLTITESSSKNIIIKEILVFRSPLKQIEIPRPSSPEGHTDENLQTEKTFKMGETQEDQNIIAKNLTSVKTNLSKVIAEKVPIFKARYEEIMVHNPGLTGEDFINTENKKTLNSEIQFQINEALFEEIAIPKDLPEMAIHENINNNYENGIIEQEIQDEDSDNSVREPDFILEEESCGSSKENENDLLFSEEEIERKQKLKQEKEDWKGRSKKGRHNKYPGQTFATRKKLKDSNKTHYTVKGKLKEV